MIEKLTDDLDGSEAAETVSFGLDGTTYEVDLSKKNAAALRKSLERYVGAARRAAGSRPTPRRRAVKPSKGRAVKASKGRAVKASSNGAKPQRDFDLGALREWAGVNGVEVPSRGRIPRAVVEQYKAAGGR
jgi:nucleoid-associated protein Lsr2